MSLRSARWIAVLAAASCAAPTPPVAEAFTVGRHPVEMVVPEGWQRYDQGDRQRFEHGRHHISLTDLGPATREAYHRELAHARDLFRSGQIEDARTRIERIRLRRAFPTDERWEAVRRLWTTIRDAGRREPPNREVVDRAYGALLTHVAILPTPDLNAIVDVALPEVGHDAMRGIAERTAATVDGRPGVRVDTWDRLSHAWRKRCLFVLVDGDLLVLRMELGEFADMERPFDTLSVSLRLPREHDDAEPR